MLTRHVCVLSSTNTDGYVADRSWLQRQIAEGVRCSECENVVEDKTELLGRVIVDDDEPLGIHFGTISRFTGPKVLSNELVDVLGSQLLTSLGRLVPLEGPHGQAIVTHKVLMGRASKGLLRGPDRDAGQLCPACHRVLYWPGWPPQRWYLLSRYWADDVRLRLIGGWLILDEQLYNDVVRPANLPKVIAYKIPLLDQPTDGLPADYEELIEVLRHKGT